MLLFMDLIINNKILIILKLAKFKCCYLEIKRYLPMIVSDASACLADKRANH